MSSIAELFARRVRDFRVAKGLRQQDLADGMQRILGIPVHQNAIAKVERLERTVKVDEAAAIASVLKVSLEDLLTPEMSIEEKLNHAYGQLAEAEGELASAEHHVQRARVELARCQAEVERLIELQQRTQV